MNKFENIMEIAYNNFEKKIKECKYQYETIKLKNEFITILNNYYNKKYIDESLKNNYENKVNIFLENLK